MDITFEANFVSTGTPDIRIYKVVGEDYELVKTDVMTATPETGRYAYFYEEGNQLYDYSARMELAGEKINGVYNSIFQAIFNRAGGAGGSITYANMTKAQVLKFVEMAKELFQEGLDDLHINIPEDLGRKEVAEAINEINLASTVAITNIKADIKKAVIEKSKELSVNITNNNLDILSSIEGYLEDRDTNLLEIKNELSKGLIDGQEKTSKEIGDIANKVSEVSDGISMVEKVSRMGVDRSMLIEGLIGALTEDIFKEITK